MSTVFLDRDGVINRKPAEGNYVTSWTDFEFLPGVLDALARLFDADMRTVVVTNQRGIARGVMTEAAVRHIHERMSAAVADVGGRLEGIYFCPHDGGCECRKPKPGLLLRAERELGLDMSNAVLVGDRLADLQAGAAVGARTVLLPSDVQEPAAQGLADHVAPDLPRAVRWILKNKEASDIVPRRRGAPATGIIRFASRLSEQRSSELG